MTQAALAKLGRSILRRLSMDEWIKGTVFSFHSQSEMLSDGEPTCGQTSWNTEESTAVIWIVNVESLPTCGVRPIESVLLRTLVHEILHLLIEGHGEVIKYDRLYERSINRIADALVDSWESQECQQRMSQIRSTVRTQSSQSPRAAKSTGQNATSARRKSSS